MTSPRPTWQVDPEDYLPWHLRPGAQDLGATFPPTGETQQAPRLNLPPAAATNPIRGHENNYRPRSRSPHRLPAKPEPPQEGTRETKQNAASPNSLNQSRQPAPNPRLSPVTRSYAAPPTQATDETQGRRKPATTLFPRPSFNAHFTEHSRTWPNASDVGFSSRNTEATRVDTPSSDAPPPHTKAPLWMRPVDARPGINSPPPSVAYQSPRGSVNISRSSASDAAARKADSPSASDDDAIMVRDLLVGDSSSDVAELPPSRSPDHAPPQHRTVPAGDVRVRGREPQAASINYTTVAPSRRKTDESVADRNRGRYVRPGRDEYSPTRRRSQVLPVVPTHERRADMNRFGPRPSPVERERGQPRHLEH